MIEPPPPPGEGGSPPVLDRTAMTELREMTGGDAAFLAELVETFLAESPVLLDEMRVAVASGDAVTLRRAAHTLKANCRTFGAGALAALCEGLEIRAAAGDLTDIAPVVESATGLYPAVASALRAEVVTA